MIRSTRSLSASHGAARDGVRQLRDSSKGYTDFDKGSNFEKWGLAGNSVSQLGPTLCNAAPGREPPDNGATVRSAEIAQARDYQPSSHALDGDPVGKVQYAGDFQFPAP